LKTYKIKMLDIAEVKYRKHFAGCETIWQLFWYLDSTYYKTIAMNLIKVFYKPIESCTQPQKTKKITNQEFSLDIDSQAPRYGSHLIGRGGIGASFEAFPTESEFNLLKEILGENTIFRLYPKEATKKEQKAELKRLLKEQERRLKATNVVPPDQRKFKYKVFFGAEKQLQESYKETAKLGLIWFLNYSPERTGLKFEFKLEQTDTSKYLFTLKITSKPKKKTIIFECKPSKKLVERLIEILELGAA